jgi:hypothetical protein
MAGNNGSTPPSGSVDLKVASCLFLCVGWLRHFVRRVLVLYVIVLGSRNLNVVEARQRLAGQAANFEIPTTGRIDMFTRLILDESRA